MKYRVNRFSVDMAIDYGLDSIDNLSSKLVDDPNLGNLRPVKRYGKFAKITSKFLKKKKKSNNFSETDPITTINPSEANKFKTALNRVSRSMGSDSNQDLFK